MGSGLLFLQSFASDMSSRKHFQGMYDTFGNLFFRTFKYFVLASRKIIFVSAFVNDLILLSNSFRFSSDKSIFKLSSSIEPSFLRITIGLFNMSIRKMPLSLRQFKNSKYSFLSLGLLPK